MSDTIHLEIITAGEPPQKINIRQLYLPAYNGMAGVLEDHKPYISLLKAGKISYTDVFNKNHYLFIRDGCMEVKENNVVIISDSIETGETLSEHKEKILGRLTDLNEKIQSFMKIREGLSSEEILKIPDELAQAINEQQEYEIRKSIILKMEDKEKGDKG